MFYFRIQSKYSIPFELPKNVEEEGAISEIIAYKYSRFKLFFYILGSLLTLGFLHLLCYWSLTLKVKMVLIKADILEATRLLIFCKGFLHFYLKKISNLQMVLHN